MGEVTQEPWREVIAPIAAKFSAAWLSGGEAIWNAEGSEAMAKLLTRMAEYLDNGNGYFVPAEALTTAQAEIEALRSLVGDAYETLKRIEQCAGEALVVASAKDACDKIDAALWGSQT